MAVGVASTGIHQTTNIKFSQLRREFKTISPRTTFNGSDDHTGDTGSVSASELLRNTSLSAADPVVPDVDENNNIVTTESNWNISGFKNAIKYYYLNQTGIDDNEGEERVGFSVTDPSVNSAYSAINFLSWKESIGKNILKKAFIDGVVGSISTTKEALSVGNDDLDINNLVISIGGSVFGSCGLGGAVGIVTLTLASNYSFPLGAAVTQYTGVGTDVAVGIVFQSTTNSNTVVLYEAVDQDFIHRQTDFSSVAAAGNLYVNNTDISIKPTSVVSSNSLSTNGYRGGSAIAFNLTGSSNNVKMSIGVGGTVYGGGGGGAKGGDGENGGARGAAAGFYPTGFDQFGNVQCTYYVTQTAAGGGTGGFGGVGGLGRGYLNYTRPLTYDFEEGSLTQPPGTNPGGGAGGAGGEGGDGGDWGSPGTNGGNGSPGGTGNGGGTYSPCAGIFVASPDNPGAPGKTGATGGSGGEAIKGGGWAWESGMNTDTVDPINQLRGSYNALPSP